MQLRSLLLLALLAAPASAGCGVVLEREVATPGASASDLGAATLGGAPPKMSGGDANPAGPSSYPPSVESNPPSAPAPMTPEERDELIAGIAFTAMGSIGATMGGFLLGFTGGACNSADEGCPERVALPILGALFIGGSVVPLVLGVSIWAPKSPPVAAPPENSKNPPPKKPARLTPEVRVGPAAAAVRLRF
jgi:hypothetical protein